MNKCQRLVNKIALKWSRENKEPLRQAKVEARIFIKRNWKIFRVK